MGERARRPALTTGRYAGGRAPARGRHLRRAWDARFVERVKWKGVGRRSPADAAAWAPSCDWSRSTSPWTRARPRAVTEVRVSSRGSSSTAAALVSWDPVWSRGLTSRSSRAGRTARSGVPYPWGRPGHSSSRCGGAMPRRRGAVHPGDRRYGSSRQELPPLGLDSGDRHAYVDEFGTGVVKSARRLQRRPDMATLSLPRWRSSRWRRA